MTQSTSALVRFLRFLGKVRFTMILLLLGAAAMVVGTVVESRAGVEVAQGEVYRTWWFDLYLAAIVVNLVVAVVNRIPIQRQQWAFVLTHASIVALMFGAWVSRTFGYEGRMAVAEGGTESRIYLDDTELRWRWQDGTERAAQLGRGRGLAGRLLWPAGGDAPELRVAEHVPHGVFDADIFAGDEAQGPGVSLHLHGRGVDAHDWLIGESRAFRRKDVGPVEVELVVCRSEEFLRRRLPARDAGAAAVEIRTPGGTQQRIELPAQLGQQIDLGSGVKAKAVEFVQRAQVRAGGLTDNPDGPLNPAAVVELTDGERTESLTLFSEFPAFNVTRGRDAQHPLADEVRLVASSVSAKPLVSILVDVAAAQLYVQLSAAAGRGEALAFAPGQTVGVGNLGIDLRVHEYLPHARPVARVVPTPANAVGEAWLRLGARLGDDETSEWIRFGTSQRLTVAGRPLQVAWQNASVELPFRLALDDFEVGYHPGSMRPSQYASHMRVLDADAPEQAVVIAMNRPLDHRGFRMFQSSYRLGGMGQPDQTILTVSRDPGVAIVYPSFFLLIVGVGWYLIGGGRRARVGSVDRGAAPTSPDAVPPAGAQLASPRRQRPEALARS